MEPTVDLVLALAYPTAPQGSRKTAYRNDPSQTPWQSSPLNVQTRINSLGPLPSPSWRLDGCEVDGAHYFAVPNFMLGKPPLRIDVYLPTPSSLPAALRDALQVDAALSTPSAHVNSLAVSSYILQALEAWSRKQPDLEARYRNMPFGSRIVVNAPLASDVRALDIQLVPNCALERAWQSVRALEAMWRLGPAAWPATIGLEDLRFVRQIHDTIAVVRIAHRRRNDSQQEYVFKAPLRETHYFYHELKLLLALGPPHAHVVRKPLFVVTTPCRFGGKTGVCGFVLAYHGAGTLQRALATLPEEDPARRLNAQLRWSRQLVSALRHIRASPVQFYANLKPVNVVMRAASEDEGGGGGGSGGALDAVLIDLEQRSGFFAWAAPEIRFVHVLEHVATFGTETETRARSAALLRRYMPSWTALDAKTGYRNPRHGYAFPWLILMPAEREAAMVFMLGRLLWCIFEGVGSAGSGMSTETFREGGGEVVFPEFRRTPVGLRGCVRACTAGAPEWMGRGPGVVRRGGKLWPAGRDGGMVTAEEIEGAAREWWDGEVREAEAFVEARMRVRAGGVVDEEAADRVAFLRERPSLRDVAEMIDEFEESSRLIAS